jgi:hypothetical protein
MRRSHDVGTDPGDERVPNRTKGVTTPALAPRARSDTNAGLATVDDVCLATRQLRYSRSGGVEVTAERFADQL